MSEKYLVKPKYDWATSSHEDRAIMVKGKKWDIIDKFGKELVFQKIASHQDKL